MAGDGFSLPNPAAVVWESALTLQRRRRCGGEAFITKDVVQIHSSRCILLEDGQRSKFSPMKIVCVAQAQANLPELLRVR